MATSEGSPKVVSIRSARRSASPPPADTGSERVDGPEEVHVRSGLTKTEAEELLDWLEANGHRDMRLSYQAGNGFTVEYH
jgi:hypothetical protein